MTAPGPIVMINPDSAAGVTIGMRQALRPYARAGGPAFECVHIRDGPATIASAQDVARAAIMLLDYARARPDASAFVIACFYNPGLDLLRASIPQPVLGLQETGVLTAMARADLFGIIALSPTAAARHRLRLRLRQMGVLPRMVGELGLSGVSALDAGTSDAVFAETSARGRDLVAMGAGVFVLGCAGFAPRRRALEQALGVAVIDPVQAAAGMALAAALAWRRPFSPRNTVVLSDNHMPHGTEAP